MFSVKDYCINCTKDAYGGSIELVDDGIRALLDELREGSFPHSRALCGALEGFVDDILVVSTSVLPLINLLIKVLSFAKAHENDGDVSEVRAQAVELLEAQREVQNNSTEHIGEYGARLIPAVAKLGTFSTSGSVMTILEHAVRDGKKLNAVCFEARPHNEGYRTMREIAGLGIPVTLGVDALLCCLIPKCDVFVIGADAITATGEAYAKTGSYQAALVCRAFNVPFYVAADTSKFDTMSVYGFPLKDSSRPREEVMTDALPDGADVANISFELIPQQLIHGYITEKGIVPPDAISGVAKADGIDDYVVAKLAAWLNADRQY